MMHDTPDLLEGLRRTPVILSDFVKTIPENKLDLRRGDGFWTIAEHVSHLAQVQPMLLDRFSRFMTEDHPEFVPYLPGKDEDEPDTPIRMNMSEALEQFGQFRKKQLILLEKAGESVWQKTGDHPEYDRYSLYILTRHTLMHDYWHMYRMEELWLTKDAYLTRLE
jgi:DinB superfamily